MRSFGFIFLVLYTPGIVNASSLIETRRGITDGETYTTGNTTGNATISGSVSIGLLAPGYIATYAIAAGICLLAIIQSIIRSSAYARTPGCLAHLENEKLMQTGFRASKFGRIVKWLAIALITWLQTCMLLAVIGHYKGVWIFDLSIPVNVVDWDSYTRVFVLAWVSSILIMVLGRIFRDNLSTFFMMPVNLAHATHVQMTQTIIDDSDPRGDMAVKHSELLSMHSTGEYRKIDFLLTRFTWSNTEKMFVPGRFFGPNGPKGSTLEAIRKAGGLTGTSVLERVIAFGKNEIILNIPSLPRMVVNELSSFFYIYQISACWLPFYWDYITVGILTLTLVISSAVIKIYMERKQKLMLRSMATMRGRVWVQRDGLWVKLNSEDVTVGDLICLTTSEDTSKEILVDCVVVKGNAIIDESSLTGETMPIQKFTCPNNDISRDPLETENKKYYLFAGTGILQTAGAATNEIPDSVSDGTLAVVTAIGANTVRGQLIRGLVFGAPLKSSLFIELKYTIGILVVIELTDFFILNARFEMSMSSMLTAMYSIIGLINPLMSVALLAGEMKSASRLKAGKKNQPKVFARDVHRLTVAGKTNLVLLDKTGTITKPGLDFFGVVGTNEIERVLDCKTGTNIPEELSLALGLAHSVSKCGGQRVGHQVELRMVEAAEEIGWNFSGDDFFHPFDPTGNQWAIEKMFPFSHESMTMSVVVTDSKTGRRLVICKGSFEALKGRCSDISDAIVQVQDVHARDGCYVIGVGFKEVQEGKTEAYVSKLGRHDVERGLKFGGLILFRNEVKPDSAECIAEIKSAGIDCAMLTGDSVYTGTSVAKQVGIITKNDRIVIGTVNPATRMVEWKITDTEMVLSDDLFVPEHNTVMCITGEVYSILRTNGRLDLTKTKVYGRVSPAQKAEIVRLYSNENRVVAMCGDGGNDSGALRAAHAGLAINGKAEASVAAPFSTNSESLSSLTLLIRESRASLCTSLASYRTLVVIGIMYCVSKSIMLFQAGAYLSGVSYLYLDLVTTPLVLFAICNALPAKRLAQTGPEGSLLGPEMVVAASWTIIVDVAFLVLADLIMVNSSWYVPFTTDVPLHDWQARGNTFESALIFLWCAWVYVDTGLVYSYGSLHRRAIWTNWRLMIITTALFMMIAAILFSSPGTFTCAFKVNCTAADQLAASDAFINNFLFYYEKIGGPWYGVVPSTVFPQSFQIGLFFILLSMSIVHHIGYKFIATGPFVTKTLRKKLGWTDGSSCCPRRNRVRKAHERPSTKMKMAKDAPSTEGTDDESAYQPQKWETMRGNNEWGVPRK
jgi:cation-transporting ATPase 13A3/4/5